MEEGLIKRLISSIKCGSCGHNYEEDNIDVMEHRDELWFLKVVCSSCHVKSLVAAIIREDERVELITDLSETERDKFRGAAGVGVDDVLEMHRFLAGFDGDFPRLFQGEDE